MTGISPSTLSQGTTTPVTITGSGFISGAVVLTNQGGITVSNVIVVNSTQITADLTVSPSATQSARNVAVELPGTGPGAIALALGACSGCLTVS